jgi:hypothetical protein
MIGHEYAIIGRMFRLTALVLLLLFPASLLADPPKRGLSAHDVIAGLTSHEPAVRDRATRALKRLDGAEAQALGREILRAGEYEARVVLDRVSAAGAPQSATIAIVVLEHTSAEVRTAAFDMIGSLTFEAMDKLAEVGFTPGQRRALRNVIEDPTFMRDYCLAAAADGGDPERLLRVVVFLDRTFGPRGWCLVIHSLLSLMETEDNKPAAEAEANPQEGPDSPPQKDPADADDPDSDEELRQTARQADRLRASARDAIEAILLLNIGTEFNYVPRGLPETRARAMERMRERLTQLESQPVETMRGEYKGSRYGDYLQSLFNHDVAEIRAAAYLRLRWMKGEELALTGEEYAKSVDEFMGMSRREVAGLRRDLRMWWAEFRARMG